MFNTPTYKNDKREVLKPVEYPKSIKVYNLVPQAVTLKDANGLEYQGVTYEPTFIKEYDIQEYIASFSDDVGIQNILKKLAISGDTSILNQTGRDPLCPNGGLEPIQDYSNVPTSKAEAFNFVEKGVAAYDALPEEIKGKMSLTQFVNEFGQAQFDAFVEKIKNQYSTNNKESEVK